MVDKATHEKEILDKAKLKRKITEEEQGNLNKILATKMPQFTVHAGEIIPHANYND
jgi:hypothetical protein